MLRFPFKKRLFQTLAKKPEFVMLHCRFEKRVSNVQQRWRYETLGISESRTYQPIETLQASDALGIPLNPNVL
jgi:hypothetical protein